MPLPVGPHETMRVMVGVQTPSFMHEPATQLHVASQVSVSVPQLPHELCRVIVGVQAPCPLQFPKLPHTPVAPQVRVFVPQLPHGRVSVWVGVQPEHPPLTHAVVQVWHMPPPAPHEFICEPGMQASPAQHPEHEVVVQVQCPETQACPSAHAVVQSPQCWLSVIVLKQLAPQAINPGRH